MILAIIITWKKKWREIPTEAAAAGGILGGAIDMAVIGVGYLVWSAFA